MKREVLGRGERVGLEKGKRESIREKGEARIREKGEERIIEREEGKLITTGSSESRGGGMITMTMAKLRKNSTSTLNFLT